MAGTCALRVHVPENCTSQGNLLLQYLDKLGDNRLSRTTLAVRLVTFEVIFGLSGGNVKFSKGAFVNLQVLV